MYKVFKISAAIAVAQVLLQIIGCSVKAYNINRDPVDTSPLRSFNVSFSEQNVEYQHGMNWSVYQPLEVIYDFMEELNEKFPELTELTTIGETYEKRQLKVLRISENPEKFKKIWIDGGIHAREWITPATVTYMMHQLLTNWQDQPKYMRKLTWYFMPVMNPDGYVYSHKVERYWRKNRSPTANPECFGVDLNRNFDTGWAMAGSSSDPCEKEVYHGPSAGSELETQAVKKFLTKNKNNLASYLTFHGHAQAFIYPWSYKNVWVEDAADLQRIGDLAAKRIEAKTGFDYEAMPGKIYGIIGGSSQDWSRKALGVKYVYTVELRDKNQHGFELPPDQIIPTGQEGIIVAHTVAEAVGDQNFDLEQKIMRESGRIPN